VHEFVFRGRRDRPVLIWIAPIALVLLSVSGLLFVLLVAIAAGDATVHVLDQPVTARQVRLVVAPVFLALNALQLLLAYAFVRQRTWARPLAVALPALWFLLPALLLPPGVSRAAVAAALAAPAVLVSAVSVLYLYGTTAARDYYRRLSAG
jgi:hypothetical protein